MTRVSLQNTPSGLFQYNSSSKSINRPQLTFLHVCLSVSRFRVLLETFIHHAFARHCVRPIDQCEICPFDFRVWLNLKAILARQRCTCRFFSTRSYASAIRSYPLRRIRWFSLLDRTPTSHSIRGVHVWTDTSVSISEPLLTMERWPTSMIEANSISSIWNWSKANCVFSSTWAATDKLWMWTWMSTMINGTRSWSSAMDRPRCWVLTMISLRIRPSPIRKISTSVDRLITNIKPHPSTSAVSRASWLDSMFQCLDHRGLMLEQFQTSEELFWLVEMSSLAASKVVLKNRTLSRVNIRLMRSRRSFWLLSEGKVCCLLLWNDRHESRSPFIDLSFLFLYGSFDPPTDGKTSVARFRKGCRAYVQGDRAYSHTLPFQLNFVTDHRCRLVLQGFPRYWNGRAAGICRRLTSTCNHAFVVVCAI